MPNPMRMTGPSCVIVVDTGISMDEAVKDQLKEMLGDDRIVDAENIWETLITSRIIAEDVFGKEASELVVFKIYQALRIEEGVRELAKTVGQDAANKYKHYMRSTVDPTTLN